ncbi:hypothetical protein ACJX0J_008321, partial [Zea mays]
MQLPIRIFALEREREKSFIEAKIILLLVCARCEGTQHILLMAMLIQFAYLVVTQVLDTSQLSIRYMHIVKFTRKEDRYSFDIFHIHHSELDSIIREFGVKEHENEVPSILDMKCFHIAIAKSCR